MSVNGDTSANGGVRRRGRRHVRCLALILLLPPLAALGQQAGEDDDLIDPTRPTVLESATVPRPGVLQLEYGMSTYFARNADGARTTPLGFRFAPNRRVRLDFDVDPVTSERQPGGRRMIGVGDTSLAFKFIPRTDPERRLAAAFSYSVKLPSASADKGLGSGRTDHNLRLILQRTPGKMDLVFNASYLNVGRDDSNRRASGAQAVIAVGRELPRGLGVVGEAYGQTVDEPAGRRGAYTQGVVTYKVNQRLRFDTGVRFGLGGDTQRVGVVAGIVVGVADLYRGRRQLVGGEGR